MLAPSLSLSSSIENCLVRSYERSFNGFAAKLTDRERQKLASECCMQDNFMVSISLKSHII